MADKLLKLEVVTPDKQLLSVEVQSVVVKSTDGEIGIMANHAPLIAGLVPHVLRYTDADNQTKRIAVTGGFVEVLNNSVSVLAPAAEKPEMIDQARAEAAKVRAQERLSHRYDDATVDVIRAEAALRRAIIRLDLAKYL